MIDLRHPLAVLAPACLGKTVEDIGLFGLGIL
jgi:hypothetical protein